MENNGFKKGTIFSITLLFAGIILIGIAAGDTGKYESSLKCKNCHDQIYNEWNGSMHAQALVDPIYTGVLSQQKDTTICVSCHAPTTELTGDFNLTSDITKEAINCDFCHTISGLNASDPLQSFILSPGEIKYGPNSGSASMAHKTQNLEVLTKSEFCGGCHQMAFPNGLVVINTYSEWKNSAYAKDGIQCQGCHMPQKKHTFEGGHSLNMLQTAGNFSIDARIEGTKVYVTAVITNDRAGHMFPTAGQLILNISATDKDGKALFGAKKILSRIYGDANGNIVPVPDIATQVLSDNRVPPKEKSTNEFVFDAPESGGDMKITGILYHRLEPEEVAPIPATKISESSKTVSLAGNKTQNADGNERANAVSGFEAALAAMGILSIFLLRYRKKN